jgi:hypothetical protein
MIKHVVTILLIVALVRVAAGQAETKANSPEKNWPTGAIHAHVCGFHFYSGDMKRQVTVHHYCSHWTDEILQCVLFDSDKPNARMIGIEYIVSAKLFESLPAEEKKLWHSHNYEVKSGALTAPDMNASAEKDLMKVIIGTYGKTWHTWQSDRYEKIPLGIPQLVMGFTADGQANQKLFTERDAQYHVSNDKIKGARADIADVKIDPGADAWQKGQAVQLDLKAVSASSSTSSATQ